MKEKLIRPINISDVKRIPEIASLYREVFAGPPWNENTRCPENGNFYGPDTSVGSECPDCSNPLEEAYPQEETVEYILSELTKSNPIGFLAFIKNELIGFSWGYRVKASQLAREKWKTEEMQEAVISLLGENTEVLYDSEEGVSPEYRNQGIASEFIEKRVKLVGDQMLEEDINLPIVVRTNLDSPMYGILLKNEFTQIIGPIKRKNSEGEWVKTEEVANGIIDKENEDRVLFRLIQYVKDERLPNWVWDDKTPQGLIDEWWNKGRRKKYYKPRED